MWPGNPGHASTQGAAFYAQDFTSDISVCTVSGHCHGTKHGLSYTKSGDTKHESGYNQHTARNHLNPDGNDFHHGSRLNHRVRFNGHIANYPARNSCLRQPCANSGNARRRGQRGIGNRRYSGHHPNHDRNFDHGCSMHAFQQRQHGNVNHGEQHAFHG